MNEQYRKFYDFFKGEGFIPANKDSYPVYKKYEQYSLLQEMGAVIIAAFSFAYNGLYKIINGYLCSVFFYEGKPVYWTIHRPDASERKCSLKEIIDILYDLSQKAELPFFQIKFIEERYLSEFESIENYEIKTEFHRDECDYVYPNKDFLTLSGKINDDKRSRIKKYIGAKNMTFKPMTNENKSLCFEIGKRWCSKRECSYCESFAGCEAKAIEIMVDIFDEKTFIGYILYDNEELNGYVIAQVINEKITHVYFGKSTVMDCFAYCLYWLSKEHNDASEYLNLNEDMGHNGIRMFKSHLGKYELWNNYICTFIKKQ